MANDGMLTCTELKEIDVTLEDKFPLNAYDAERTLIKAGTLAALLAEQTATFPEIRDKSLKENTVQVNWLEACPIATKTCDTTCTDPVDGVEFGDNCFDVDCNDCIQAVTVQVSENTLKTSTISFDEIVAAALYQADKAIAETLNITAIGVYDAAPQINMNLATWGGAVVPAVADGTCTTVQASIWTDPFNYFNQTATLNNFSDPYLLSGNLLSKFGLEAARLTDPSFRGEGFLTLMGWRVYYDLRTLDQTIGEEKVFMVNKGQFAYVNCYNYPTLDNPLRLGSSSTKIAYRLRSPILSGLAGRDIFHNVVYTMKCDENSNILSNIHCWEVSNNFAIIESPDDCSGHNTVLCFTCV